MRLPPSRLRSWTSRHCCTASGLWSSSQTCCLRHEGGGLLRGRAACLLGGVACCLQGCCWRRMHTETLMQQQGRLLQYRAPILTYAARHLLPSPIAAADAPLCACGAGGLGGAGQVLHVAPVRAPAGPSICAGAPWLAGRGSGMFGSVMQPGVCMLRQHWRQAAARSDEARLGGCAVPCPLCQPLPTAPPAPHARPARSWWT